MHSQQKDKHKYDPFQIPANLNLSKLHRKAKKVGKNPSGEDYQFEKCPCCHLVVDKPRFRITEDIDQFAELGTGTTLYFYFVKYVIILLILVLLLCSCYNFGRSQYICHIEQVECFSMYGIKYPINYNGNYRGVQLVLNIITVMVSIVAVFIFKFHLKKKQYEFDDQILSVRDYTVYVEDIDRKLSKQDIKNYFEKSGHLLLKREVEVKEVILVYQIEEQIKAFRQKVKLIEKVNAIKKESYVRNDMNYKKDKIQKLENKVYKQDQIINKLENAFLLNTIGDYRTDKAFVIFKNAQDKEELVEIWKESKILNRFKSICDSHDYSFDEQQKVLHGKKLYVTHASEPMDILWENLNYTFGQILKLRALSVFISIIILSIGGLCIYFLTQWQNNLNKDRNKSFFLVQFLGLFASVIILLVNTILMNIYTWLSKLEKHSTHTGKSKSMAVFLSWAQFLNTAAIPFLLLCIKDTHYYQQDMLYNLFWIFLGNALIYNGVCICDPLYFYSKWKRNRLEKKGYKSSICQYQANLLFEELPFFIDEKYAFVNKTYLTSMFFAPIFPMGIFFEVCGLLIFYWISKFLLIRRSSFPNQLSGYLNTAMIRIAFCGPLMFSLGSLCYDLFVLKSDISVSIIVWNSLGILLSILCILFSDMIFKVNKVNLWLKNLKIQQEQSSPVRKTHSAKENLIEQYDGSLTYDEALNYITINYHDVNPIEQAMLQLEGKRQAKLLQFYYGSQGYKEYMEQHAGVKFQDTEAQNLVQKPKINDNLMQYCMMQPQNLNDVKVKLKNYIDNNQNQFQAFQRNNQCMNQFKEMRINKKQIIKLIKESFQMKEQKLDLNDTQDTQNSSQDQINVKKLLGNIINNSKQNNNDNESNNDNDNNKEQDIQEENQQEQQVQQREINVNITMQNSKMDYDLSKNDKFKANFMQQQDKFINDRFSGTRVDKKE